jgi:predicted ATPase/DNA-binding CsgD family transcriptional regulator
LGPASITGLIYPMSGASIGQAGLESSPRGSPDAGSGRLPRPLTGFIGRERELAEARRLLAGSCLLTLTGPGGSGKTRLSVELAAGVACDYPDGVYFVRLAPVRDPGLVLSSIAQSIGLQDPRDRPLAEHLVSYLRDRKLLIVLDNFEHLLPAASAVAELLSGANDLRIVVSSRAPLRVSGEQECPVPPLALPDEQADGGLASVAGCESVRLFTDRAAAVVPGFAVDERNAAAVARIVRRLDGLPLAIELAAARVKLLPPEAICGRLEHSLGLLTGGSRDLPRRQQTLRATIEWSYALLGEQARGLLAACSVFRGGVPLDVIESVCAETGLGISVLDGLQELVDQSLLRRLQAPGPPRYLMLETIREFAAERLAGAPEAARFRGAHAAAFLALAEQATGPLTGLGQKEWLERLDVEHNNIRAAIDWYRQEDPPAGLRLAAAMSWFWSLHGHYTEGRQQLRLLLGLVSGETTVRVRALNGAAWLALDLGDYPGADRLLSESTELSRRLNDTAGEGMAAVFRCRSMLSSGRVAEAAPYAERASALLTEADDRPGIAFALFFLALNAQFTGDLEAACGLHEQCVALCRELGFESLAARALQPLGIARLELGDLTAARTALQQGLPASVAVGDRFIIPIGLAGFAGLAAKTGKHRMALRLSGAAEAYRDTYGSAPPAPVLAYLKNWLAVALKKAGAAAPRLIAQGRQMTLTEALEYALADEPEEAGRPGTRQALTRRETEVARLAAQGLTNRDIAARLYLSVRTVEVHVDHILTKLGFGTRTQLAAWAHQEGLLPEDT